ncbi:hypothetical protein DFP92_11193 [Yoonia sediminilitoris]|uniref:Secreted protein n=2 Tax=Yoonia sediminilitoris TaxID=1286148 RepID=A0A2T6KBC1_9RHOB|nr:hypothetical protein [Yoonia sediminilitoris]PUB12117.1 hypothetical protein C8N45_11194 [Yoonia sediminilitoris]RCW92944.1 hypothetical protein DFP92_11193 [Yoonia sediminilitoris]
MTIRHLTGLAAILLMCGSASAQTLQDPIAIAEAQGACAPFGVKTAIFDDQGSIRVTCNEDATAFVPLLGGLAPLVGLGAVATVAAAISGGNATPNTR